MKYRDLQIQTQRKPPNKKLEDGIDFLYRAYYLSQYFDDILSPLGARTISRLLEVKSVHQPPEDFFAQLNIPIYKSEQNELFFLGSKQGKAVLHCLSCKYVSLYEVAKFDKKVHSLEPLSPIKKVHTPDSDTIESLANYLKIPKEKTAKALMFWRILDQKLVFVVVRGDMFVSEAKLRNLIGEFRPATREEIIAAGASPGYASPIGLKKAIIIVDDLITKSPNLVAGANESGYHFLNVNYERDYTAHIIEDIVQADQDFLCPNCNGTLKSFKGLLVAKINGQQTDIHYYEILVALAETNHDEKGLTIPHPAAPFDVYLMHIPGKELDTHAKAEEIYNELQSAGISVLFDDRDERAGVKFNDADLIGCPIRVTVGEKGLKEGMVELKPRKEKDKQLVLIEEIAEKIKSILKP
ncbi:MAG TPA: His/Gly/Thr/Pro-type tRNA ligase C-terminal domain-containing protein [Anaerolineales bacterium]|nr:His/Gly/Thr/Pro-type tRNA ligase C-terminal domain-containing protein [Anaerolineales bacterium]